MSLCSRRPSPRQRTSTASGTFRGFRPASSGVHKAALTITSRSTPRATLVTPSSKPSTSSRVGAAILERGLRRREAPGSLHPRGHVDHQPSLLIQREGDPLQIAGCRSVNQVPHAGEAAAVTRAGEAPVVRRPNPAAQMAAGQRAGKEPAHIPIQRRPRDRQHGPRSDRIGCRRLERDPTRISRRRFVGQVPPEGRSRGPTRRPQQGASGDGQEAAPAEDYGTVRAARPNGTHGRHSQPDPGDPARRQIRILAGRRRPSPTPCSSRQTHRPAAGGRSTTCRRVPRCLPRRRRVRLRCRPRRLRRRLRRRPHQ